MPAFGRTSRKRLVGVHPTLVEWSFKVVTIFDCSVIYGVRTPGVQKILFNQGFSRTLDSKHLKQLDGFAHAVDLGPYINGGIPWDDHKYFYELIGVGKAVAYDMGIEIINGSDWDRDGDMDDQEFMDLAHNELVLPMAA